MKDKDILLILALSRGSFTNEKKQILKKHLPGASPGFIYQSQLLVHVLLLVSILPNVSTFRIYEHAKLSSSIVLRILVKFNLLVCDKSLTKHKYNITPLTRAIISDLISAYKHNLNQFYALNKADKNTNYIEIKAKIKHLKQK